MAIPKNEYTPYIGLVLDFETGGLECQTSAVTQIAIHAIRIDTFEKIGSYVSYVYPYDQKEIKGANKRKVLKSKYDIEQKTPMEYGDKALEYSAISMDMLYSQGKTLEVIAKEVLEFLASILPEKTVKSKNKKTFIIGQNIWFDEGFLSQIFEFTGLTKELSKYLSGYKDFYGNWHPKVIDTQMLGWLALSNNPSISSYRLEALCEQLGVELDDAHDADADVTATANVLGVLTQRMRNSNGVMDGEGIQMNKVEKSRKHFKI